MKPVSETRERFLNAIAQRVNSAGIEEMHVFQPIKQGGLESGVAVVCVLEATPTQHARHAVYTAQYRLTLKGPDRGKWEFSIKADADAPLVTVDAVVRGVQKRSGDAEEPIRLSGDEIRELLPAPPAAAPVENPALP